MLYNVSYCISMITIIFMVVNELFGDLGSGIKQTWFQILDLPLYDLEQIL